MKYAQLGKTDLRVSRICFGCWQLSPSFWGKVPLDPWRAALRRARDLGVNFIDTADAYGDGCAESSLGEFLASDGGRDEWIIATKFYWNIASIVKAAVATLPPEDWHRAGDIMASTKTEALRLVTPG